MTERMTSAQYRHLLETSSSKDAGACDRLFQMKSGRQRQSAFADADGGKKPRAKPVQHEYIEQVKFFAFVNWLSDAHPERTEDLLDVYSTSSGGLRSFGTAIRLKLAGQRDGIPDIECLVPAKGYHGLVIELKPIDRGAPTVKQQQRIDRLNKRGYLARVIHGWLNAAEFLCNYLDLSFPKDAELKVEVRMALERLARKRRKRAKAKRKGSSV